MPTTGRDAPSRVAFVGGSVLTMAGTPADAVVIEGDRVAAVGDVELLAAYPDARVVNLRGRTLCPGFIDAHNHLSIAALHPQWADLAQAPTIEALTSALRAHASGQPHVPWIRGAGWHDRDGRLVPHRRDLDALGLDRPVVVAHYTLHQCVVDSRALADLGIGRTTPDPPGGEIGRDTDGEPNGLLLERAWSEAHARSVAGYRDPRRWAEHIRVRAASLITEGITAVHDAACSPEAEAVYRTMAKQDALPISVLVMPHPSALLSNDLGPRIDGPLTGAGDEQLRVGPVKLFADGGVSIALDVSIQGRHLRVGTLMADLEQHLVAAVRRGYRVAVHAIGNLGVERAIGAFMAGARLRPDDDHRFRVEHLGVTSTEQCRTLSSIGAVGVVQPGFVEHVGRQARGVRFDGHHWLAFADLAAAGVPLAASSDDPCAPFPPLWGASLGATRLTSGGDAFEPDQALDLVAWLEAYTTGAAYAGGQEHERGRIAPGLRADLVVLDGPLDAQKPPTVAETWIGGHIAYRADADAPGTVVTPNDA